MKLLTVAGIVLLLSGLSFVCLIYGVNPSDFYSNILLIVPFSITLVLFSLGVVSLALARTKLRPVYGRTIGVAFLVVALSVPGVVYYAEQQPITGCLSCTGPEYLVLLSGSITQSPSGSWNLTVWAKDYASGPVTMISVTNSSSLPKSTALVFNYNGAAVSSSNPLPLGYTAVAHMQLQNLTAGNTYEMTVSTSVQGKGEFNPQTLVMTAQA